MKIESRDVLTSRSFFHVLIVRWKFFYRLAFLFSGSTKSESPTWFRKKWHRMIIDENSFPIIFNEFFLYQFLNFLLWIAKQTKIFNSVNSVSKCDGSLSAADRLIINVLEVITLPLRYLPLRSCRWLILLFTLVISASGSLGWKVKTCFRGFYRTCNSRKDKK